MELRICDFRNSKFQGQAINKQPGGFGFALDQKYTFIATQWYNSNPIGPYIAIFDDSSKLFATDTINTNNFTVYTKKQLKIYKTNRFYVIDLPEAHILVKVQDNQKNPITPKSNRVNKVEQKIKVIQQKKYTPQNYTNILSGLLDVQTVPNKLNSYNSFIKETFKQKHKNLLNIRETSKDFCLSFHQNGIFIKLTKKNDLISSIGFDGIDKKPEIMRKYSYYIDNTRCTIEESVNSGITSQLSYEKVLQTTKDSSSVLAAALSSQPHRKQKQCACQQHHSHNEMEQKNPQKIVQKQCVKNVREYYKRSLTFINKYLNFTDIYSLKSEIDQIVKQLNIYDRGKYGQIKIQNNGYQLDANQNPIIPPNSSVIAKQCNLDDLKNQLEKVNARKSVGRRRNSNRRSGNLEITPLKQNNQNGYKSPPTRQSRQQSSYLLFPENTSKKIKYEQTVPKNNPQTGYNKNRGDRSKSHKPLKYLESDSENTNQKNSFVYQPSSRNDLYRDARSQYTEEKRKSPKINKFKYTQQEQDSSYNKYKKNERNSYYRR